MVEPPVSALLKKVDSIYTLCILVGKRARQLTNGAVNLSSCDTVNPITIASHEIDENKIGYSKKKNPRAGR